MIVENESNWRTEDLEALLESVLKMECFEKRVFIRSNTLLLFTTSRAKSEETYDGKKILPPAADYDPYSWKHENTVIVKICSGKRLEMEVLDRVAHIGNNHEQDMKADDVVKVAQSIGSAIGTPRAKVLDYSWAKSMSLRLAPQGNPRSKVALRRVIDKLENDKQKIQAEADRKKRMIDEKIWKLRAGL